MRHRVGPVETNTPRDPDLDDDGNAVHERSAQAEEQPSSVARGHAFDIEAVLLARKAKKGREEAILAQGLAQASGTRVGRALPRPSGDRPPFFSTTRPRRWRLGLGLIRHWGGAYSASSVLPSSDAVHRCWHATA